MVSVVGLGLMILLMVVICVLLISIKCQTRKEHRAGPGLDDGHDVMAAIFVYGHYKPAKSGSSSISIETISNCLDHNQTL